MKRSDATAALSWANNTRVTGDTRITSTEFHVLCVIAGGCKTRAQIAAAVGCSESTVPRAVRKLVKIGALERRSIDGKANDYTVIVRQMDTGIVADTGITTGRITKDTRITEARAASDTGADGDTGGAVDNERAHIEHACARADTNLKNTTLSELNSETLSQVVVVVPANSDRPPPPLWQQVLDAVRSPFLDENKQANLILEGYIVSGWVRDGADIELDVIPTVRRLIERKGEPVPWDYFTKAVRQAAAKRKQHAAANPITTEEANAHDTRTGDADPGVRRRPRSALTQRAMQLMSER